MMRGLLRVCAVAILPLCNLLATPALAQEMDGHRLREACREAEGQYYGFCLGFLTGAIDAMELGATAAVTVLDDGTMDDAKYQAIMAQAVPYCLPPNASIGVIRDELVVYLDANEGLLFMDMHAVLITALSDIYPCTQ